MKLKYQFVFASLALLGATALQAQTVINITGATAFRDAAHLAIIATLGGDGVAQRARVDLTLPGNTSASNLRIYRGFAGGNEYIVRATFSGSTQGILDLADQNLLYFLKTNTTMATTGNGSLTGATVAANAEQTVAASFSFSDVENSLSQRPLAVLGGGPVGVVPFMFIAGKGAPAGITNMTDQLHEALWNLGQVDSAFLGAAPGTTVLATGRSNGSGTRATILSETGYGAFRSVVQFNATTAGAISQFPTTNLGGGHTSNSGVSAQLNIDRATFTFGGSPADAVFVSYLTVSDAITLTGYNQANGTSTAGAPVPMTYNGVRYSVANVQNGAYTLWGYQQLYTKPVLTTGEAAFDALLRASIAEPANLGSAGIATNTMTVTRTGGDGGLITPGL